MHIMDFFDKHKALILTSLFCGIVVLALYNFRLSQNRKDFSEMMINLEEAETKIPEENQKEKEQAQAREQPQTSPKTHRAFNENSEERQENFQREIDEIFEKNSASREENQTSANPASEGEYNINSEERQQEASDGDDSSEEISRQAGSLRNSSISFSLKGRNPVFIPNPIYTCDRAGKIVVNIRVDQSGRVTETQVNKASSSSTNECLQEKALEYAAGARFSKLAGRNDQPGTITYRFKP